jgi:6-pyruvoyltetrahydropterin/6-carboxytetrahydropterin synthase
MRVTLTRTFGFEAAHRLPLLPTDHKCHRLHGHSFSVDVSVTGDVDPALGWLMDYAEIAAVIEPVRRILDHNYLNDIRGLENPTSEVLARWIWERLSPELPALASITVRETCTSACTYTGD